VVGGECAATCLAFEDSPTGLGAAVAAGIPTVGVMTSQPRWGLADIARHVIRYHFIFSCCEFGPVYPGRFIPFAHTHTPPLL